MTNTARPESFHIVGEQIAATLHIAHMALENYVEGDADPQGLDKCVESLHAARGALLLLEVYGASLLAEEKELTCEFLASESQGAEHLTDEVIEALNNRPKHQHVIITGRACHRAIIELADTVSEVQSIKHAFDNGIKAQKGIDW